MLQLAGPLSAHMGLHILLMNAAAPLAALAAASLLPHAAFNLRRHLWLATIAQLAVLWAWHAPPALSLALGSAPLHLLMQAMLFLCAFWFWSAVFHIRGDRRWRAILALLLTSKLFCLLGVLLVFAPRALYPAILSGSHHGALHPAATTLDDQQLAGLLMLVACPATYVLAGVVIAARWFAAMDSERPALRIPEARRAV